MYAIKSNKERIDVRKYSSAFLPSYTSAAESSMGKRRFVVPGYIFLPKPICGAEKVPTAEWNVIEALSDSHQSTLDTKTGRITDGSLKGLLILHINPVLKSVCIRAKLLGVTRDYWLAVRFSDSSSDMEKVGGEKKKVINLDGAGKEKVVELKQTKGEVRTMDYTQEQIDEILKRAKEVGIHQSARENSVPWQKVQSWAKKAGVEITPKVVKPKKAKKTTKPESSTPATTPEPAAPEPATPSVEEKKAEKTEEKPVEKPKRGRKKKAVYEVVEPATPAVAEEKAEQSAPERPENELMVENAVLRKENEQLKAKIEKLQKALADLM